MKLLVQGSHIKLYSKPQKKSKCCIHKSRFKYKEVHELLKPGFKKGANWLGFEKLLSTESQHQKFENFVETTCKLRTLTKLQQPANYIDL